MAELGGNSASTLSAASAAPQEKHVEVKEIQAQQTRVVLTVTWLDCSKEKNEKIKHLVLELTKRWYQMLQIVEKKEDALNTIQACKPLSAFGTGGLRYLADDLRKTLQPYAADLKSSVFLEQGGDVWSL